MYVFLLLLGGIVSAAGVALIASGVSIQQHTFDAANLPTGTIATVGGCVLIGLAFVVRALLRVERALSMRPMLHAASADETAAVAQERSGQAVVAPAPPPLKLAPQVATGSAGPPPLMVPAVSAPPEHSPAPERLDTAPVVEEEEIPLLPKALPRAEEENRAHPEIVGRANGKVSPQAAPNGRRQPLPRPAPQPRSGMFDTLWPKPQRAMTATQAASAAAPQPARPTPALQSVPNLPPPMPLAQAPSAASKPSEARETALRGAIAAAQEVSSQTVSVLKSGVVEGMAYTLYSDGSIEAQLPQGTLRFGSITELRNHIEQNS